MTANDKLFLQTLNRVSRHNQQNPDSAKALRTSRAMLSDELLSDFEIENNDAGAWFFNVYVEFEPLFKEVEAQDWQKKRGIF